VSTFPSFLLSDINIARLVELRILDRDYFTMLTHAEPMITYTASKAINSTKDRVIISIMSLEEQFCDTIFTDFEGSPPIFGGSEWDENDTSHEDLRRPPMRPKPGMQLSSIPMESSTPLTT
jgi:hypothetical protein